jgi:hypothetical protein
MSKTRLVTIVSIIGITAIVAVNLPLTSVKAEAGHEHSGKMDMKAKPLSLENIHSGQLPTVSQSIDKAIKAVKAGNKETALAELLKAQKMLAAIKDGIGKHIKPKFANARCPIMNSPINSDKVTKNLIRDYKGQKVAFCCAGCPSAWDKLTDAQKQAKLAKVKPEPSQIHPGHKH